MPIPFCARISRPSGFLLFPVIVALGIFSCNQKTEIPFPDNPNGWQTPKAVPFSLPEETPIRWDTLNANYLPKKTTLPFIIGQMPSKPFTVNDFEPISQPISEIPFVFEKLKSIAVNLDTVKPDTFSVRKFLVPPPQINLATIPSVWRGGTSGLVKLGQAEGLVGNRILAMFSDSLGVTWITTEQGLNKYDGRTFAFFNFFQKDQTGATETLSDIVQDAEGNLLISSESSGIYRFNPVLGIAEHFRIGHGYIRIELDSKGQLWGSGTHVYKIDLEQKTEIPLKVSDPDYTLAFCYGVNSDADGNLWIGYQNTIGILAPDQKTLRLIGLQESVEIGVPFEFMTDRNGNRWISAFSTDAYGISLKDQKILQMGAQQGFNGRAISIKQDFKDRLWFSTNDTIFVYDPAKETARKIHTRSTLHVNGFPPSSQLGSDGILLQGSASDGLLIYDTKGMMPEHFTVAQGLESNDVWGIVEDDQARVYLSTYKGLNIYDPKTKRLHLFTMPPAIATNNYRRIRKIEGGRFLLSALGGFGFFDLSTEKMDWYDTRNTDVTQVFFTGFRAKDQKFWFGGGDGVNVFDPATGVWTSFSKIQGLAGELAFVLEEDSLGRIWVATDTGLSIIDPAKNTIRNLKKSNGLPSDYTSMLYLNAAGEMIVGTNQGIAIFNPSFTEITHISAQNGLNPPAMYDLVEEDGIIQIGSERGIIRVHRPKEDSASQSWQFYNYGLAEGYPYVDFNQSTAKVLKNGQAWWGVSPVLTVNLQEPILDLTPAEAHIYSVNIMDQHSRFSRISDINAQLSVGDTLWAGNSEEFVLADQMPADSGYYVNNNFRWEGQHPKTGLPLGLEVPDDQNSFSFDFINTSIRGRDKILYSYLLDGVDTAWSKPNGRPFSKIYYNLEPGTYTFKVASVGFNSQWSAPDSFSFTIRPPWNQTWWAYLLFVSIFGGLTYGIVYLRSKYLQKENRILEDKVLHRTAQLNKSIDELKSTQSQLIQSEKMASLGELTAGIAHEIQNPLNFVNNFSELSVELAEELKEELAKIDIDPVQKESLDAITEDLIQNQQKIHHHGKRADAIVKGMLQHSRTGSGQKEPTDIGALADEYLRLSYHGIRAKDKSFNADFRLELDPDLPKVNVVAQDFGRVLLNLINNAFYACTERSRSIVNGNGKMHDGGLKDGAEPFRPLVVVSAHVKGRSMEISVTDNGSGIPDSVKDKIFQPFFTTKPTGQGTGLGLSLSYDIVKAHGGELKVESQEGVGTKFTITLEHRESENR